jgi:hypothetical protein
MLETILTSLESLGINLNTIIMGAITGLLTWLGGTIKKFYNEHVKNKTIRTVIDDCVKYVEQKSKTEAIQNKYEMAKDKAVNILNSKGINITDDEIDLLIESFVNSLTKEVA